MTNLNKSLVAAERNSSLQMVAGSDVNVVEDGAAIVATSSPVDILPPENLPIPCNDNAVKGIEGIVLDAEYKVVNVMADETDLPTPANNNEVQPPQTPDEGALGTEENEEVDEAENASPFPDPMNPLAGDLLYQVLPDNIRSSKVFWVDNRRYSRGQIDEAIKEYELAQVLHDIPPSQYIVAGRKSVRISIENLLWAFALKPFLMAIPKRMGAHPNKGIPAKRALIEFLYGLKRYEIDLIESLDAKWVRKAIKWGLNKKRAITLHTVDTLKNKCEEMRKTAHRTKAKEAKNKFYETLVTSEPQKADEAVKYAGAIVDLTQMPDNCNPETLTLPFAENALVLVAVMPKDLQQGMDLLKTWGLKYVDNVVFDRDKVKGGYIWSINQHTNILIATKGEVEKPLDYFRLKSILFEPQALGQSNLPDYYYDSMTNFVPAPYLECFSSKQFNKNWFVWQPEGGKNV